MSRSRSTGLMVAAVLVATLAIPISALAVPGLEPTDNAAQAQYQRIADEPLGGGAGGGVQPPDDGPDDGGTLGDRRSGGGDRGGGPGGNPGGPGGGVLGDEGSGGGGQAQPPGSSQPADAAGSSPAGSPAQQLPFTGFVVSGLLVLGVALLAGGAALRRSLAH